MQQSRAQAKKFQPAADVVNDQNSTSNDVAEKSVSAKSLSQKRKKLRQ